MVGGFDRIVELDQTGKPPGSLGSPGHKPGQFARECLESQDCDAANSIAKTLAAWFDSSQ